MGLDDAEKLFNRMVASVNSVVSRAVAAYKGVAPGKSENEYSLQDMMVSTIADQANKNRVTGGLIGGGATLNVGVTAGQLYYDVDNNQYYYA